MMEVWKTVLQWGLPILFGLGAGFASVIIKKKPSPVDEEQIKTIMKNICLECGYRDLAIHDQLVRRQIDSAKSCLTRMGRDMKADFLRICTEYTDKDDLLKYPPFLAFRSSLEKSNRLILERLDNEFTKNHISKLSIEEIDDRVENLYIYITETFDDNYNTDEHPTRVELFDKTKVNENKYKKYIKDIYGKAIEIYKNKDTFNGGL